MTTEEFLRDVCPNHTDTSKWNKSELLHILELRTEQLNKYDVIWRCIKDITNIYGETIFTKGLVYEQVKVGEYPMILIDNKTEESEVSNLEDFFTYI